MCTWQLCSTALLLLLLPCWLLQDVVIVGCAAAGVMGVGPDSQPFEVDPLSDSSRARAILTARRRAGLPPPPSKGVSVLLGKLPVGCVARGLVFKVQVLKVLSQGWQADT